MQMIPPTGRSLARSLGVRYKTAGLHDPATSLDFGTRYLRQLIDRFGGRVERVLAAYNAGPHRVDAWTAAAPRCRPRSSSRASRSPRRASYVMTILANREHYRRHLRPLRRRSARRDAGRLAVSFRLGDFKTQDRSGAAGASRAGACAATAGAPTSSGRSRSRRTSPSTPRARR